MPLLAGLKSRLTKNQLEKNFRHSIIQSQKIIAAVAIVCFFILFLVTRKYKRRITQLVKSNHKLVKLNAPQLPKNKQEWLNYIDELSNKKQQELIEHQQPLLNDYTWQTSRREEKVIFCYCQFAMQEQENEQTALVLSTTEGYLKSVLQTYGLQSQGDILSGCLIPIFIDGNQPDKLNEALSLLSLMQQLLADLPLVVKMKAFIGCGTLLILENERGIITGISLSNRLMAKINRLSAHTQYNKILAIGIEEESFADLAETSPIKNAETTLKDIALKITKVNPLIKQRINRQIAYVEKSVK